MKNIILICGDSWASGEYPQYIDNKRNHRGISQYLNEDHKETICLSYPGRGNFVAAHWLETFVSDNFQNVKIDKILFFQSDWIRDIDVNKLHQYHLDAVKQGYSYYRDWNVCFLYRKLADIYKRFCIPTVVIGGQSDTIWMDKFEQEYPGVKIGCQSFTNLLCNQNSRVPVPTYSVFKYGGTSSCFLSQKDFDILLHQIKIHCDKQNLQELLNDMTLAQQRDHIFDSRPDLFPDHCHPDRYGHLKLYEYLKNCDIL